MGSAVIQKSSAVFFFKLSAYSDLTMIEPFVRSCTLIMHGRLTSFYDISFFGGSFGRWSLRSDVGEGKDQGRCLVI